MVIILVTIINFIVNWKNKKTNSYLQENSKAEEEFAFTLLEEPTFVYGYCSNCRSAITNSKEAMCKN